MKFEGKIAVITGGAGGLGLGMIKAFGDLGATVGLYGSCAAN